MNNNEMRTWKATTAKGQVFTANRRKRPEFCVVSTNHRTGRVEVASWAQRAQAVRTFEFQNTRDDVTAELLDVEEATAAPLGENIVGQILGRIYS